MKIYVETDDGQRICTPCVAHIRRLPVLSMKDWQGYLDEQKPENERITEPDGESS